MRNIREFSLLSILTITSAAGAQMSTPREPKPATSESTAQLIGVQAEISRLHELSAHFDAENRWQILWLHQRISERVMATSLQVDATIAQIDNEIARANEVRGYLADRRDRAVSRANLLGAIVGGSIGATSSGLQLSSNLSKPAAAVGIGAGTLSAGFAVAGIRAQTGKSSRFDFESNMLAELFDRPTLPNSEYPATVWTFLNQSSPNGPPGFTRKQELTQIWIRVNRLGPATNDRKISQVTSQPSDLLALSIDDFEDRAAMLEDVRAKISYLKRDLGILLGSLPTVDKVP